MYRTYVKPYGRQPVRERAKKFALLLMMYFVLGIFAGLGFRLVDNFGEKDENSMYTVYRKK